MNNDEDLNHKNTNSDFNENNLDFFENREPSRLNLKRFFILLSFLLVISILLRFILSFPNNILTTSINSLNAFNSNEYKNYDNYSLDVNMSKDSNGVKITINKIIYDEFNLDLFYTVESITPMTEVPHFINENIKINNKSITFESTEEGEFLNDNTIYAGKINYSVNSLSVLSDELKKENPYKCFVEITDDFLFTLEINKLGDIKENKITQGHWSFDIPVTNKKAKNVTKETNININLNNIYKGTTINKIISTPINTVLQLTTNDPNFNLHFEVFDDKGRYIPAKDAIGSGYSNNNKEYKLYYNHQFQEVYKDTESLTFIPYIPTINELKEEVISTFAANNSIDSSSTTYEEPSRVETSLNLKGETVLTTKDWKEYGIITKIEICEGTTKLYIKSKYALKAMPTMIIDKTTGESILPVGDFNTLEPIPERYLKDTGEFIVEFDKPLTGDNYSVSYNDYSRSMIIFEDNIFTVNIPK